MNVVRALPTVKFNITPDNIAVVAHILSTLAIVAEFNAHDITITSGADGEHSGPADPHHLGLAYDIRSHDWNDPQALAHDIVDNLEPGVIEQDGGWLTEHFFGWLEPIGVGGTANEHVHVQLRHNLTFP